MSNRFCYSSNLYLRIGCPLVEVTPMPFTSKIRIKVRFADIDCLGHVNNAKYFTYFEEARMAYFEKIPELDFRQLGKTNPKSLILAEVTCQFKSAAILGETLVLSTGVTSVGRSSFVMGYEMAEEQSGRLVALGRSVQVYFDYETGKPLPLPEELKIKFIK